MLKLGKRDMKGKRNGWLGGVGGMKRNGDFNGKCIRISAESPTVVNDMRAD